MFLNENNHKLTQILYVNAQRLIVSHFSSNKKNPKFVFIYTCIVYHCAFTDESQSKLTGCISLVSAISGKMKAFLTPVQLIPTIVPVLVFVLAMSETNQLNWFSGDG